MFCVKCGKKNSDNAKFCTGCGAPLSGPKKPEATQSAPEPNTKSQVDNGIPENIYSGAPKKPTNKPANNNSDSKNRKVGIIAVAAVAVIVCVIAFTLFGGGVGGPKKVIDKYMTSMEKLDSKALIGLLPDKLLKVEAENNGYSVSELKAELIEEMEDDFEYMEENRDSEYGPGWKMKYKIVGEMNIKGEEFSYIREDYADYDIKVSEAKLMSVDLTITSDYGEVTESTELYVVKIGGSWYLDVFNGDSPF